MSVIQIDKNGKKTVHSQDVGVNKIYDAAATAPVATDLETLKVRAKKRAEARNVLFNVPKREPGATQLDDWAQIKADRVIKLNANGETYINEDLQRYAKHCEKINDNA